MATSKTIRKRLTLESIRQAKPQSKQYVIWDSRLDHFGVRVYPSGKLVYILRLRFRQPDSKRSIQRFQVLGAVSDFPTVDAARDAAAELRNQYRHGVDAKLEAQKQATRQESFREVLIGYYMSRAAHSKESTLLDTCRSLRRGYGHLMDTPMVEITSDDVLAAFRNRKEQAPTRAALEARYFRAVWNWASVAHEALELGECPVTRITKMKEMPRPQRKTRRLMSDDIARWWAGLDTLSSARDRLMFQFLFYTGCRAGEAMGLKWNDIDLTGNTPSYTLHDTKRRNTVTLPLPAQLVTLIKSWKRDSDADRTEWLFPAVSRNGDVAPMVSPSQSIQALAAASGVAWSPHDLRRTYISNAELSGLPSVVIRRLTNHVTNAADSHDGYVIAEASDLAPWAQKAADRLQRLATAAQDNNVVQLPTMVLAGGGA